MRLEGSGVRARLHHRLLAAPLELVATVAVGGRSASLTLPTGAAAQTGLPAGLWQLSLALTPPGELLERESNALPLLVAPEPVILADAALGLAAIDIQRLVGPARVAVQLFSRARVRPEQTATLALGSATAQAARRTLATDPLVFEFPATLAAGLQWLRLRVDGVDSLLVDKSTAPPSFDPDHQVTVPA